MAAKKQKFLRVIVVGLLVLLIVGAGGLLWFQSSYKKIIQEKLPEISAKATDTTYKIKAGDVAINLPGRSIAITELELLPDAAQLARLKEDFNLPPLLFKISISRLDIEGISWSRLAVDKVLECAHVTVTNPVIRIGKISKRLQEKEKKPSRFESIIAGKISIINANVAFIDSTASEPSGFALIGGNLDINDFHFSLKKPKDSGQLLYARRTSLHFNSFNVVNPKAPYKVTCEGVDYNSTAGRLGVSNLRMQPSISREEFIRRSGVQTEIYGLHIPTLSVEGLDWRKLIQGAFFAGRVSLSNPIIDIYLSRVPPPNTASKKGKFPHQMLQQLKHPIYVPIVVVKNGRLEYTERNVKSMQEGVVTINAINGSIGNITNILVQIKRGQMCTIDLTGRLKETPVEAVFRLPLNSRNGRFTVQGRAGALDGTKINDIIRPLALAEIKSLRLDGLQFRIEGDENGAKGNISMPYQDLKVRLLEPENGGMDKKDATTFLANTLLIFPRNPMPGKALRSVMPIVQHNDQKSFFNLIWKVIFNGLLQSVSRDIVKVDKMVNKRAEKQEAKRSKEETSKSQRK